MTTMIDGIQRRLQRAGWTARDVKVVTLDGSTLWLVSARRKGQSFSAQSETHGQAWKLAWRLAKQLHLTGGKPSMIVPFRKRSAMYGRAG